MKKRILTLGVVLALVVVLVMPTAALAGNTTGVTATVVTGYEFTAPSAIALSSISPRILPYTDTSSDGRLIGNAGVGYTVTGTDAKSGNKGKMTVGSNALGAKLKIGPASASNYADTVVSFYDQSGIVDTALSLYVGQVVGYSDNVTADYTITITFTAQPKS